MRVFYIKNFKKNSRKKPRKNKILKRSFLRISSDILAVCKDGQCRKTQIMHECNLSHAQLQTYLKSLTKLQLLTVNESKGTSYQITEKGQEILEKFQDLEDSLGTHL